ncbi:hypothetical protein CK203_102932 [Vitis vinifera]|uniref:TIR domain-containing protein n=1 Tax=Vitis vinifera TaxID=29760 RepID=A0A438FGI9_VITVI|nr:hypothetical protein CK203_102932 [Vitis vinifera]
MQDPTLKGSNLTVRGCLADVNVVRFSPLDELPPPTPKLHSTTSQPSLNNFVPSLCIISYLVSVSSRQVFRRIRLDRFEPDPADTLNPDFFKMDASSSSQHWRYDAFFSFRGEDTRKSFIAHLYKELCTK